MLSHLKNSSVQIIILVTLYAIFAQSLDTYTHQGLYTISMFIKDILMWLMPIIVGIFIANTIDSFESKAPLFIFTLIIFEILSNFISVYYSYGFGIIVSSTLQTFEIVDMHNDLPILWAMPFSKPLWWSPKNGVIVGLVLGSIAAFLKIKWLKTLLSYVKWWVENILTKGFSVIIPIFVLGFVAQIYKTGMLNHMIFHYGIVIAYLVLVIVIYLFMIFILGNNFRIRETIRDIRNMTPVSIISFMSCCRISTMPLTITSVAKNLKDPEFAKAIIPATINFQQVGDCIANSFLCFLIYKNFFGHNPDLATWSAFSIIFVIARFATAAVAGGAIFLMLPIYQHYLHFTDEMLAIILAFNVILDPIITSSNVMANGALAKVFENIWKILHPKTQRLS
ncbi:MAG UNVERIFIED_CONTAM: cation:dicarboxylase symporter family transporter [Rickettsiaceae bacterium]|jgi:Na+/H+-dicarboxylate symporter